MKEEDSHFQKISAEARQPHHKNIMVGGGGNKGLYIGHEA
jgi:hypothetical protein